jgi:hypothetical protein
MGGDFQCEYLGLRNGFESWVKTIYAKNAKYPQSYAKKTRLLLV